MAESTSADNRTKRIENIVSQTKQVGKDRKFVLNVGKNGRINQIDTKTRDFLSGYFQIDLERGDLLFDIVKDSELVSFGEKFTAAFSGHSIKGSFSVPKNNTFVYFNFIPVLDNETHRTSSLNLTLSTEPPKLFLREINSDIKGVFDNTSIGVFFTLPTGEILDVNAAGLEMFGYSIEEIKNTGRAGLFDLGDGRLEKLVEVRKRERSVSGELTGIRKDGTKFPVQIYSNIYTDLFGEDVTSTMLIDISLQREQEQKLKETTDIFESLFENYPDAVYSFDLNGNFLSVNDRAVSLSETSEAELLNSHFSKLIPKEDQAMVFSNFERAKSGEVLNYNTSFRSIKNNFRILNITNFPLITQEGITGVFGIAQDITLDEEHKARARESQHRIQNILNQSLDVICTISAEGEFLEVSEASRKVLGYSPKELVGKKYVDFVYEPDIEKTLEANNEIQNGAEKTDFSNRYVKKDGTLVPLIWSAKWDEKDHLTYCVAKDASELKEKEEKLVRERNMLRAIIDNIPDYIFVVNRNHELILTNKKFYQDYLGKTREAEVLKLKPKDYFIHSEAEKVIDDNEKVMNSGVPVINRQDFIYDFKQNPEVVLLTKVPLKTRNKGVDGLVGIARNITETYQLEKERNLIHQVIKVLSLAFDLKQGLTDTIKTISEYLNFDTGEAWEVGFDRTHIRKIAEYNPVIWQSKFTEEIKAFDFGKGLPGTAWESQAVEIWPDLQNDERFYRRALLDKNSSLLGVAVPVILKDEVIAVLTFYGKETKHREMELARILSRIAVQIAVGINRKFTEENLNNMFTQSPNLLAVLGGDGYLKKVNPVFTSLFGYKEEHLLKTPLNNFIHQEERASFLKAIEDKKEGIFSGEIQTRFCDIEGNWKWIAWNLALFQAEEDALHIFGSDVTPLKKANIELLEYRNNLKEKESTLQDLNNDLQQRAEELVAANRELEQFAYIASHDLQEPLRMVTGFLSQLQKKYNDELDEKAQTYIHYAFDGATRMRHILLDLLEYSRAGRNKFKINLINLNELLDEIISSFQVSIDEKSAIVNYGELPVIKAAKTPLRQVLSNLIGNSLKYHREGIPPVINVTAEKRKQDWLLSVSDNGIGIETGFFEKIFVIFQRLHRDERYSGTGIGLAISKKIVERHGGKIWVKSAVDEGSTFYFTIPRQF
ncbi:PAS domain S-box protein [Salegentibacter chungangensis]|uniref:histidine kinase n=1 Tax=Salegentibacter chungangensis TaxID=1335724 RepID=A0ABW3NTA3_9FLAO